VSELANIQRPLITLDAVSKTFPAVATASQRLAYVLDCLASSPPREGFTAVADVSLQVRAGDSIAIIGENGAGKSTLLRMIAGVALPTGGKLVIDGRVSALLELGAGFNPEYSGRFNIGLSCALHGLTREEAERCEPDIIAFAELGEHIDKPVKHYSSGMVVRLGFAIATAVRPDVLIADEVLAVGDESFQRKCAQWFESYLAAGGTLILCSHVMYHVQKLCRTAIWLEHGRVRQVGPVGDVVPAYLASHEKKTAAQAASAAESAAATTGGEATYRLIDLTCFNESDESVTSVQHGDVLIVRGTLFSPDGRAPHAGIALVRADGTPVFAASTEMDGQSVQHGVGGTFRFQVRFDPVTLLPGEYIVRGHVLDPEAIRLTDTVEKTISVRGNQRYLGLVKVPYAWE